MDPNIKQEHICSIVRYCFRSFKQR